MHLSSVYLGVVLSGERWKLYCTPTLSVLCLSSLVGVAAAICASIGKASYSVLEYCERLDYHSALLNVMKMPGERAAMGLCLASVIGDMTSL